MRTPHDSTIQSWVLRIGLYQLSRAKEWANDWVVILDHTCQLGSQKCLVVLGIRLSHWRTLDRPLTLKDMTVLMIRIVERSNGVLVVAQLREIQVQIGTIVAIVTDQGSDLVNGAKLFSECPTLAMPDEEIAMDAELLVPPGASKPLVLKDYSHASSHILKENLEADPRWPEFLSHCGRTQPKVKQTALGALAPPTQKVKGRYMNIGEIIQWGIKMLALLKGTNGKLPNDWERSHVQAKYGWLTNFESSLQVWGELDQLREHSLDVIRNLGYCNHSVDTITSRQLPYRNYLRTQKMGDQLLELARSQCLEFLGSERYPGCSEIIESLMGKFKHLQGQHSRNGFTKMALSIGSCLCELTTDVIRLSLETVREIDVRQWANEALGDTLRSIRGNALPGTKSASTQNC